MQTTLGHKVSQPGLRGHSHDPAQDLMKKYVVAQGLTRVNGWLWIASFDTLQGAVDFVKPQLREKEFRIINQYADNRVVWEG